VDDKSTLEDYHQGSPQRTMGPTEAELQEPTPEWTSRLPGDHSRNEDSPLIDHTVQMQTVRRLAPLALGNMSSELPHITEEQRSCLMRLQTIITTEILPKSPQKAMLLTKSNAILENMVPGLRLDEESIGFCVARILGPDFAMSPALAAK
jgi:hypothetical protein